jgi:hypothetical protein
LTGQRDPGHTATGALPCPYGSPSSTHRTDPRADRCYRLRRQRQDHPRPHACGAAWRTTPRTRRPRLRRGPSFATQVAAAIDAAGSRWVFDGAPYNAELAVYPHADTVVALDYPRRVVQRRILSRSLRLWLTRRGDGAHTSASPPWRWWAPLHPVGWAAMTHAARHTEIAALFARPELAHAHRLRFTSPRQAASWLVSLNR